MPYSYETAIGARTSADAIANFCAYQHRRTQAHAHPKANAHTDIHPQTDTHTHTQTHTNKQAWVSKCKVVQNNVMGNLGGRGFVDFMNVIHATC